MKIARYSIRREHAPPDFWQWRDDEALVDGVEFESAVPTRLFQVVDAYPRSWGPLSWRIQLNNIVDGNGSLPLFRTFYPGVEWNLKRGGGRWFLTAWVKWERATGEHGSPRCISLARIEVDTILFPIPLLDAEFDGSLFLRSRIDARDRRRTNDATESHGEQTPARDHAPIVINGVMDQ